MGRRGRLVCPAFPRCRVPRVGAMRPVDGSGRHGWWQAVAEDAVPQREPGLRPGPVRWQVQHGPALRFGDPSGHVDQGAAQGRAAGDGLDGAGHRGGGAEQVVADRRTQGPCGVRAEPAGSFAANAAWLTLAGIAHNLTRAAGCLASTFHATARPATIRDQLINVPVRIASSARRVTLHCRPTGVGNIPGGP